MLLYAKFILWLVEFASRQPWVSVKSIARIYALVLMYEKFGGDDIGFIRYV